MAQSGPLDIGHAGVFDLMRDYEALRTWELIRVSRAPITVAELVAARRLPSQVVHRHLDLLMHHGLLRAIRARKPRRSVGFEVAVERIVFTFDDGDPDVIARATASSDSVAREFDRCVEHHANPDFRPASGFRFRQHIMKHFTAEDLAELRRLMLPVVEFLSTPRPVPSKSARKGSTRIASPQHCNQAIAIRLDPLVGDLLPLPDVWMTPRSKLVRAEVERPSGASLKALAPREREVALALAEGLTRAHVAERMGVSVHTVSTLARRAYRKLGVSSQAALAARLARFAHRKLGER